jgi:hypothetical protein
VISETDPSAFGMTLIWRELNGRAHVFRSCKRVSGRKDPDKRGYGAISVG